MTTKLEQKKKNEQHQIVVKWCVCFLSGDNCNNQRFWLFPSSHTSFFSWKSSNAMRRLPTWLCYELYDFNIVISGWVFGGRIWLRISFFPFFLLIILVYCWLSQLGAFGLDDGESEVNIKYVCFPYIPVSSPFWSIWLCGTGFKILNITLIYMMLWYRTPDIELNRFGSCFICSWVLVIFWNTLSRRLVVLDWN